MKLHEIIEINNSAGKFISYESIHPYLQSLYVWYKDEYCEEPVLMVESVMNAVQYVKIVSSDYFIEMMELYDTDEAETISFNSKFLIDFIQ